MFHCLKCKLQVGYVPGAGWVPLDTGTTANGLTYCPPDPDHQSELGTHVPVFDHEDTVVRQYVGTALWSSTDDDGNPLDAKLGLEDIDANTLKIMRTDVRDFLAGIERKRPGFWAAGMALVGFPWSDPSQIGHDLWLTRNGHGTGFWDRGGPAGVGEFLTSVADVHGECWLLIGDDGRVHQM